jgi:hypothetical protein
VDDAIDIGIDTETCVNTKLNQQQSRNGLNVFERGYRGGTPTASTSSTASAVVSGSPQQNVMNNLLFPPQSESSNGAKQTLKKNMSISTASLSSSTGSNNTNSTQSGAAAAGSVAKPLGEENRSVSKGSLNTAPRSAGANTVFDRLASSRGSLKKDATFGGSGSAARTYGNLSSASTNSLASSNRPEFINMSSDDNQEVSPKVERAENRAAQLRPRSIGRIA